MHRYAFVGLTLLLFGCSEPTIDKDRPKESLSEVKAELSAEKLQEFEEAWKTVTSSAISEAMSTAFSGGEVDAEATADSYLKRLDGRTADEVIALADSIEKAREREERQEAVEEIKSLREQKRRARQAEDSLAQFKVVHSDFYKREQRFGPDRPVIELTVVNKTDHAISRAYFNARLESSGREVPWLEEQFNYKISGGVEPGERQQWELAPNMFSDWGDVEERSDMMLKVEPYQLDGPEGDALFKANWSESDETRLQELLDEYGEHVND